MDFIEKWRMKLFGRGVHTFAVEEIGSDGKVVTLRHVGKTKRRANSIIETWDSKGSEIKKPPLNFITEDRLTEPAYIVNGGETVELYITPSIYPDRSDVIGKAATFDDIVDAMDLGKSMKNIIIGGLLSAPLWWVVFKALGGIFS